MKRALIVIALVLCADQALKIWVKTGFLLDEYIPRTADSKVYLHFIENEGMAFGLKLGGESGKLMLTLFRIMAVIGIGWILRNMARQQAPGVQVVSMALIFAGALGNIIDSTFYGILFSESTQWQKAVFLPPEGGYAALFHGAVVDMFYFPLFDGRLPDWLPYWGGEHFVFFRPVFNIADAAITCGVAALILSSRRKKHPVATVPVAPASDPEDVMAGLDAPRTPREGEADLG